MIFTDWISFVAVGCIIIVFFYGLFSIYLRKPLGLFIAATFHIILGILSLPSIGLFVLALAIIEIILGIVLTIYFKDGA